MRMIRTPRRQTRLRSGGPVRKRRKTRKGQVPEAVLDALWGKVIHARDPGCQYGAHILGLIDLTSKVWIPDCWGPMQAHHVYTKKYRNLRWDEEDGLLLCARHHTLMHDAPVLGGRFYESWLGSEKLDTLWIKAQAVAKIDRHAVKASLQEKLRALQGEEREDV